jgi:hypothetical protein
MSFANFSEIFDFSDGNRRECEDARGTRRIAGPVRALEGLSPDAYSTRGLLSVESGSC